MSGLDDSKSLKSQKKRLKPNKDKDDRSALASTFYKETFVMRFTDKKVKVIAE